MNPQSIEVPGSVVDAAEHMLRLERFVAAKVKHSESRGNVAVPLLAALGYYACILQGRRVGYRGPTAPRKVQGKKAGAFGRGIRNVITRKNLEVQS